MKRYSKRNYTIAVGVFLLASQLVQAQHTPAITTYPSGTPVNYIRTWDATAPESDPNALMSRPLKDVKQATQYFDGLGRPFQTVIKQGSLATGGTATDLVSPLEYDEFGREQYKWMPYAEATDNTGTFKTSPFTPQLAFYNDPNGVLKGQTENNYYYSQTVFEASPLNRVQESFAPGISWAGTAAQTIESNRRSVKMKYWLNTTTDDVKMWNVTDVANSFGTYALSTVDNGAGLGKYAAGELYKNVSVDEHGKQVVEFKDKEGKVILKKVQLTAVNDDGTGKNYAGWLSTYYIYDDFGNLRCVIQPEGVKTLSTNGWSLTTTLLSEQCFRYEYDYRNRMVMKQVPGAAAVYMVYDQRDRLVMTQDGNMRTGTVKWLVTLYDDLNRPVQTGLWTNGTDRQTHANAAQSSNYYYYPFNTAPNDGTWEKLTSTHYDDYTGLPSQLSASFNTSWNSYFSAASNNTPPYPQALTATTITKGLATWTETKVLGTTSQFLTSVMIYDDKGRPIQVQSVNLTGGVDVTITQYSWAGQPLIVIQKQEKAGTNAQTHVVITKMEYDDLGRVLNVRKAVNSTVNSVAVTKAEQLVVENTYDKLGRLKTKKLAPAYNGNTGLESLTYDYNIRGWMLGANRDYAKDNNSTNYFGFDLGYDKADNGIIGNQTYNNPQYNGNIEGMVWKSKGDGEKRKYDFAYDAANRIMKADFTQYTGGSFNQNARVNFDMKMGDGSTVTSAYDDNGNIKRMQQWGLKINVSSQIDNLLYDYQAGSNKLAKVTDSGTPTADNGKLGDFKDGSNSNDDYSYDLNGNLNLDNNKQITSITYNYLNLPQTITLLPLPNTNNGSRYITYTYDATGNKLKKETYESTGLGANRKITTTYINGFVYDSKLTNQGGSPETDDHTDVLQFIPQEEGRIRFKPATATIAASFEYDYMLKDHLGNVRVVLTEEQQSNQYPAATIEPATINTEATFYGNLTNTQTDKPSWFSDPLYTTNTKTAVLKNASGSQKIGPNMILKVMAGDSYNIRLASGWQGSNPTNGSNTNLLADLLSSLTTGVATISGGKATAIELQNPTSGINSALNSFLGTQTQSSSEPKAYLNWVLLNEQFQVAKDPNGNVIGSGYSGFEQVGTSGTTKIHVQTLTVAKSGYLYIYTSNESDNMNVYFDNLQVTHTRGALLEENSYYPFGLTMTGINSKSIGSLENKRKFNEGTELNASFDVNFYETSFRLLDPQTGRFHQIDPLTEIADDYSPYCYARNNPLLYNDPYGLDTTRSNTPKSNPNKGDIWIPDNGSANIYDPERGWAPNIVLSPVVVGEPDNSGNTSGDGGEASNDEGGNSYNSLNSFLFPTLMPTGNNRTKLGSVFDNHSFSLAISLGAIFYGLEIVEKPFIMQGVKHLRTSLASSLLRQSILRRWTLTGTLGEKLGKMIAKRLATNGLGAAAGRMVPIVGWGMLLFYDMPSITNELIMEDMEEDLKLKRGDYPIDIKNGTKQDYNTGSNLIL